MSTTMAVWICDNCGAGFQGEEDPAIDDHACYQEGTTRNPADTAAGAVGERMPWRIEDNERLGKIIVEDQFDGQGGVLVVAQVHNGRESQIVTEHNSHTKLVAALEFAVKVLSKQSLAGANYAPVLQQARAALAAAQKEG